MSRNYLAIDLGAENGRTIVGSIVDGKLTLPEIHRFVNGPVRVNDGIQPLDAEVTLKRDAA